MRPSEYAQLKRENDRREGALPLADREEIGRAMASIRRASWNLYELERLRKDLIDMALRAALEHKTLAESLGPGRQEIYDDMAREIDPGSFADWLCGLARPYTLWYAVLLLVNMVLGTGRAAAVFLVLMLPLFFVLYLSNCLQRRIWVSRWARARRSLVIEVMLFAVAVVVFTAGIWLLSRRLPRVAGYAAAAALVLVWAVSSLLCRARYNRAAARRPWRSAEDAAGGTTARHKAYSAPPGSCTGPGRGVRTYLLFSFRFGSRPGRFAQSAGPFLAYSRAKIASPMAAQPTRVHPSCMISAVRSPASSTPETAASMASASAGMSKL